MNILLLIKLLSNKALHHINFILSYQELLWFTQINNQLGFYLLFSKKKFFLFKKKIDFKKKLIILKKGNTLGNIFYL